MNLLAVNVLIYSFRRDSERLEPMNGDAAFAISEQVLTSVIRITTDRDFARFPGLKCQHPLDHSDAIENPT